MNKSLFIILVILASQSTAFGFCKLNQFGHNICTGEKGLFIVDESAITEEPNTVYEPVTIRAVHTTEATVEIEGRNIDRQTVHIDKITGNKLCEKNDPICSGEKVVIKQDCKDPDYKSKYKVVSVYENEVVELSGGGFFNRKNFLSEENCVDPAKK